MGVPPVAACFVVDADDGERTMNDAPVGLIGAVALHGEKFAVEMAAHDLGLVKGTHLVRADAVPTGAVPVTDEESQPLRGDFSASPIAHTHTQAGAG